MKSHHHQLRYVHIEAADVVYVSRQNYGHV